MKSFRQLVESALLADGPRFLTEGELNMLAGRIPSSLDLHACLNAEIVLRAWLKTGGTAAFHTHSAVARDYFYRHATAFQTCHGVVLCVAGNSYVLPVPFLITASSKPGGRVVDECCIPLPGWEKHLPALSHLLGLDFDLKLRLQCGVYRDLFTGNSFLLAAAYAWLRVTGEMFQHSPLAVICSGGFIDDKLQAVAGLVAKRATAQAMSAIFIGVGAVHNPNEILQEGISWHQACAEIRRHLMDCGHIHLKPRQILDMLKGIQRDLHTGKISSAAVSRRVDLLQQSLHAHANSPFYAELQGLAALVKASAANHTGDATAAAHHLQQVQTFVQQSDNPLLWIHLNATRVVALTDAGDLHAAEQEGRTLYRFAVEEFKGELLHKLRARMTAAGVLGGQPLLQLALTHAEFKAEARQLLEEALAHAQHLEDPAEISRDSIQLFLWYALHCPEQCEVQYPIVMTTFENCAPHGKAGLPFLLNYRLLGAMRRLLFADGFLANSFSQWQLPEMGAGESSWLLATALKYRSLLYHGSGECDKALTDLCRASHLLATAQAPVIHGMYLSCQRLEPFVRTGQPLPKLELLKLQQSRY